MSKLNQKGFTIFEAVMGLTILLVIIAIGYSAYETNRGNTNTSTNTAAKRLENQGTTQETPKIPTGWTIYKSEKEGFSLAYPKEWRYKSLQKSPNQVEAFKLIGPGGLEITTYVQTVPLDGGTDNTVIFVDELRNSGYNKTIYLTGSYNMQYANNDHVGLTDRSVAVGGTDPISAFPARVQVSAGDGSGSKTYVMISGEFPANQNSGGHLTSRDHTNFSTDQEIKVARQILNTFHY